MKLLEHNYSNKLQEFILEILQQKISNKKELKELIKYNFIDIYDFNIALYEFMKENSLLEKDNHMLFMTFEAELFSSLYGIKYKKKYGPDRILDRTGFVFSELVQLLDYIPANTLKYIAPYLQHEDAKTWFEYMVAHHNKDNYSPDYVAWVIYALLNTYEHKDTLIDIANFLQEKHIHFFSFR